jgi:hypothetical protein
MEWGVISWLSWEQFACVHWPLALEAGRVQLNQRNWVAKYHGRVEMDTIRQSDIGKQNGMGCKQLVLCQNAVTELFAFVKNLRSQVESFCP